MVWDNVLGLATGLEDKDAQDDEFAEDPDPELLFSDFLWPFVE
jgi:hypothetical protein